MASTSLTRKSEGQKDIVRTVLRTGRKSVVNPDGSGITMISMLDIPTPRPSAARPRLSRYEPSQLRTQTTILNPATEQQAENVKLRTCRIVWICFICFIMDFIYIGFQYPIFKFLDLAYQINNELREVTLIPKISIVISVFVLVFCVLCFAANILLAFTVGSARFRRRIVRSWIFLVNIFMLLHFTQMALLIVNIVDHKKQNQVLKTDDEFLLYESFWMQSIVALGVGIGFFLIRLCLLFVVILFNRTLLAPEDANEGEGRGQLLVDEDVIPQLEVSEEPLRGGFYRLSTIQPAPPRRSVTPSPRRSVI